jgi:hypothetical protein
MNISSEYSEYVFAHNWGSLLYEREWKVVYFFTTLPAMATLE